jgi:hypothetical protein
MLQASSNSKENHMLTTQQLQTLKDAILAETDVEFAALRSSGATGAMAEWLNVEKAPAAKAWRSNVDPRDSDEVTPWANFDALTAGKRDSYIGAFLKYSRDYSKNAVRKWITDIWGNASVGSDAATILAGAGQRNITRAEAVLGGSATTATNSVSALKLAWEGFLSNEDVVHAVNLV